MRRAGKSAHVTDFVSCVSCSAVYYLLANTIMSDPEFKNDAAYAAGFYKKPGRQPR